MRYLLLLSASILSLGAFHVLAEDAPAVAPAVQEDAADTAGQAAPEVVKIKTVGDILEEGGNFLTFIELVKLAGMDSLLAEQATPYTLFVPTDEAFLNIGDELKMLKKPENRDKLVDLLNHHIVSGMLKRADLNNNTSEVLTSTLKRLRVVGAEGRLNVNGINIEDGEISSDNAVIYRIDAVIEKEAETAPAAPAQPEEAPAAAAIEPSAAASPAEELQKDGDSAAEKPWYRFW